jgi:hypothetical protein
MVNIVRPGSVGGQDRSQISTPLAGAGQVALGRTVRDVGIQSQVSNELSLTKQMSALIDQQGKQMFEESKRSHQSATLLNKTTEATEAFMQAQQDRYSRATDEDGNPTFQTLHSDIDQMGNKILDDTANKIIDPEVSQKFRERFGGYIANQKISALKHARNQQISFGRASLDNGLGKLVQQAAADDIDQLASYEQQGIEALQDSLQGGSISHEEFQEKSNQFSAVIRGTAIENAISKEPEKAAEMLTASASELGISEEKKEQLTMTLAASAASDVLAVVKANELHKIDETARESELVNTANSKIEADAMREDDLLKLQDKVAPKTFTELSKKFIKEQTKRVKERQKLQEIGSKIASSDNISTVKPSEINKYFEHMVKQRSDNTQGPVSLSEGAQMATAIPAPVSAYAKKLEGAVKFGNDSQADDMLSAYTYIKDRRKPTLESGFDKEATLIMEHTQSLVERGGLNPKEALIQSRELIDNKDDQVIQFRNKQFNKVDAFKNTNLEETAASDLDAESFLGTNRITADSMLTYKQFVREGFSRTGNMESARAYATQLMGNKHGNSEISGSTNYMFAPPEKTFPSIPPSLLRKTLVADVLPALPKDVDSESVSVESDGLTSGNIPSWVVTYELDVNGTKVRVPLLNEKTGQPMRWNPLGSKTLEEAAITAEETQEEKFEEARAGRRKVIREQQLTPEGQTRVEDAII